MHFKYSAVVFVVKKEKDQCVEFDWECDLVATSNVVASVKQRETTVAAKCAK